jgi:hypothetical protein
MAPLITAAIGLAQYIPDLLQLFGRGNDSAVAQKVLDIAQKVSGKSDATQAMAAISSSPDAQLAMQKMLLEDKWVQSRLDLDNVKSARAMHEKNHAAADDLGKHVIRWNLPLAFGLFIVNIVSLYFFREHVEILLTLGNLTGFLLNSLLKERQDIINFYFGSSLGSKDKDKLKDTKNV